MITFISAIGGTLLAFLILLVLVSQRKKTQQQTGVVSSPPPTPANPPPPANANAKTWWKSWGWPITRRLGRVLLLLALVALAAYFGAKGAKSLDNKVSATLPQGTMSWGDKDVFTVGEPTTIPWLKGARNVRFTPLGVGSKYNFSQLRHGGKVSKNLDGKGKKEFEVLINRSFELSSSDGHPMRIAIEWERMR